MFNINLLESLSNEKSSIEISKIAFPNLLHSVVCCIRQLHTKFIRNFKEQGKNTEIERLLRNIFEKILVYVKNLSTNRTLFCAPIPMKL